MNFDINYVLMILPALLISGYAQIKVSRTFNTYLKVKNLKGITGAQSARSILNSQGMTDVRVELVNGHLNNHYDPRGRVVRLSQEVFNGDSIVSIGVAAHEAVHGIQDGIDYLPLKIRTKLVPFANISSTISWIFFVIGLFFELGGMGGIFIKLGIILFSVGAFIQIITLPVELNASKRAMVFLNERGYLSSNEYYSIKKVLSAASFVYVAGALVGVFELAKTLISAKEE